MRKLIESTIVSLDGVIESPDRWAVFDQEAVVDLRLTEVRKLDNGSAILSYVPELNGRAPTS